MSRASSVTRADEPREKEAPPGLEPDGAMLLTAVAAWGR
jgi:hypothetical protein